MIISSSVEIEIFFFQATCKKKRNLGLIRIIRDYGGNSTLFQCQTKVKENNPLPELKSDYYTQKRKKKSVLKE